MERIAIQTSLTAVEMLRRDMVEAGNRRLLAIKIEDDFNRVKPGAALVDLRKQWIECRHIVDQFADDYATAIHCWRKAVQASAVVAPVKRKRRRTSSTLFPGGSQRIDIYR